MGIRTEIGWFSRGPTLGRLQVAEEAVGQVPAEVVGKELEELAEQGEALRESGEPPMAGDFVRYTDSYPDRATGAFTKHVALVTRVVDASGIVNLCVFVSNPRDAQDGVRAVLRARWDTSGAPGTWR